MYRDIYVVLAQFIENHNHLFINNSEFHPRYSARARFVYSLSRRIVLARLVGVVLLFGDRHVSRFVLFLDVELPRVGVEGCDRLADCYLTNQVAPYRRCRVRRREGFVCDIAITDSATPRKQQDRSEYSDDTTTFFD